MCCIIKTAGPSLLLTPSTGDNQAAHGLAPRNTAVGICPQSQYPPRTGEHVVTDIPCCGLGDLGPPQALFMPQVAARTFDVIALTGPARRWSLRLHMCRSLQQAFA